MSWLSDLGSGLGIPAGAATLAGAMYVACVAAEKAARPEALADIGRILKDPSWSRSARPSAIIQRVFVWTFGERHLSWKCVKRSSLGTIAILLSLLTIDRKPVLELASAGFGVLEWSGAFFGLTIISFIPDYLALWKTRQLLNILYNRLFGSMFVAVSDTCLSLLISALFAVLVSLLFVTGVYAFTTPLDQLPSLYLRAVALTFEIQFGFYTSFSETNLTMYSYSLISTLFTSIWTILILLSIALLKLLAPIHRFTAWFFDVDKHPVQAIGIVSGTLVMITSLIWSVVRALV